MAVAGIVLAGGSGSRLQQDVNKVLLAIRDTEMLGYSLDTMLRSPEIDRLVLVVRHEERGAAAQLLSSLRATKPVAVVDGGATRHQSERHGLESLSDAIESGTVDFVAIHDGARPFMTTDLLHATIAAARRTGGAVPGLPFEAPVYQRHGRRVAPISQETLRRIQTPQIFRAAALLTAYRAAERDGREGVDTAETVGRYADLEVAVVPGDPRNIKVTFVEDIFQAEEYAASWHQGAWTD